MMCTLHARISQVAAVSGVLRPQHVRYLSSLCGNAKAGPSAVYNVRKQRHGRKTQPQVCWAGLCAFQQGNHLTQRTE
jgi:hypothetical protein